MLAGSAFVTGVTGTFYAQYFTFIDPGLVFGPSVSVEILLRPIEPRFCFRCLQLFLFAPIGGSVRFRTCLVRHSAGNIDFGSAIRFGFAIDDLGDPMSLAAAAGVALSSAKPAGQASFRSLKARFPDLSRHFVFESRAAPPL